MTSRWYVRAMVVTAALFVVGAVLSALSAYWVPAVVNAACAAAWAVLAIIVWRRADREAEAFAWHMFKAGIAAGVKKSEEVHHCEHEWSRYRDERTEAHGWQCTRCEAIRL